MSNFITETRTFVGEVGLRSLGGYTQGQQCPLSCRRQPNGLITVQLLPLTGTQGLLLEVSAVQFEKWWVKVKPI